MEMIVMRRTSALSSPINRGSEFSGKISSNEKLIASATGINRIINTNDEMETEAHRPNLFVRTVLVVDFDDDVLGCVVGGVKDGIRNPEWSILNEDNAPIAVSRIDERRGTNDAQNPLYGISKAESSYSTFINTVFSPPSNSNSRSSRP